ncbi:SDR family NAD(P)-dependent oxidoreductase [Paraburkholderia sp. Ac-20336]|uniref:type I polyketide synthase n=1 Tax=Paraburkholderia sp. Ac-20336 TaxID=2703886 RepID=UPI00197EF99B|nr:type I polyketide synthase [Paraburkholderia sp. Ac-20336]MBN3801758.1 SDR family NAD(P)-dependent oxidoreductase [Paraburkholderia sp. Ac-20336]
MNRRLEDWRSADALRPDESVSARDARIAIVGIGCRFPGPAISPDAYWRMLLESTSAVGEVPAGRWSLERFFNPDPNVPGRAYVRRAAFLQQPLDRFDAAFFGISPREAMLLDPQQRLLLEVAAEALDDGGIPLDRLRGSQTGVYVGGFMLDNQTHLLNTYNRDTITTHTAIGSTMVMLSNRLSYTFDLRGPSMSIDTACSSSLVALHVACSALLAGECEMALCGGVNVMLRPEYMVAMCKGGFLAPDGLSKAFDASGDGYGRGEGAGLLILKPLHAALRDGDPIRAVIAGTGINQDGRTEGITTPNAAAQSALIRQVQASAGVNPDAIQYVEAHGTGTRAGDRAESGSIGASIATQRNGHDALRIGSAKTHIGHLEAAAGMAGVIKTVLALEHRVIPPNLHFNTPNPDIDFAALRLHVPVTPEPWPAHDGPAGAAINGFGYGGTNAHAILFEAPQRPCAVPEERTRPAVFPLSAASESALIARARQFADLLDGNPAMTLNDIGYTVARHRTQYPHRVGIVADSPDRLAQQLRLLADKQAVDSLIVSGPHAAHTRRKVAFVFTGMGPQFYGMGVELIEREPLARSMFERCEAIWQPLAGWSLGELFTHASGQPMTAPEHAQVGNLVLQLMLTEVARSYGLHPEAVVGHSVGEIAAAYASGALGLADALLLTYHRSRLMQRTAGLGKMLAVDLGAHEIAPFLKSVEGRATIAAVNSPTSVTVAGDSDAIVQLNEVLTVEHIFSRILKVEVAYHSHHIDPFEAEFNASLASLVAHVPTLPAYSTVSGTLLDTAAQTTAYWWQNARQPVRLADALATMIADGYDTFVEVGPHPVLAVAINACLRHAGAEGISVPLQRRDQDSRNTLLGCVAQLYCRGAAIDWRAHYPAGQRVALPNYPWDRDVLWSETELSRADRLGSNKVHPLLAQRLDEPHAAWDGELAAHLYPYMQDHQVQGEAILPAAAFIEMALVAKRSKGEPIAIDALTIHRSLSLAHTPIVRLQLDDEGSRFTIHSRARDAALPWSLGASGRLSAIPAPARSAALDHTALATRCSLPVDLDSFYRTFAGLGLQYGPAFRCLQTVRTNPGRDEAQASIEIPVEHAADAIDYYVHPVLLDGALQTLLALKTADAPTDRSIYLPVSIDQVRFQHKPGTMAICHARLTREPSGEADEVSGDLVLYDAHGQVAVELFGVRARAVKVVAEAESSRDALLYKTDWRKQTAKTGKAFLTQQWLIFNDADGMGDELAARAHEQRIACITVTPGEGFRQTGDASYEVARESRDDMARLMAALADRKLDAAIYLWGLDAATNMSASESRVATGIVDTIDLLHIVQEFERARPTDDLALSIATLRTQHVVRDEPHDAPGQHALLGVGRVLTLERPQSRVRMIDLNSAQPLSAARTLLGELVSGSDETEVAFRDGERYVARIVPWREPRREPARSTPATGYAMQAVAPAPNARIVFHEIARCAPRDGEVEIALQDYAIDVSDTGELDGRASGIVVTAGREAGGLQVGDRVAVLAPTSSLVSHVTVPHAYAVPCRPAVAAHPAATRLDWALAWHALFDVAQLRHGESVLIHRAESGFGIAAAQLARWKGATVFTTAGTAEQCDLLRDFGIAHVSDGRSLRFVDEVSAWTSNAGVDVVLNRASGNLRDRCFGLLASRGRFVDIAKASSARQRASVPPEVFERGFVYVPLDPERVRREQADTLRRALDTLTPLLDDATFKPLPTSTFLLTHVDEAWQMLAKDTHSGNVSIDLRDQVVELETCLPRPLAHEQACYLVTGGFTGLGLETVKWLAMNGARHIAVLSRSGPRTEEAQRVLDSLRDEQVQVWSEQLDIADAAAVQQAIAKIERNMPPIRGVIHSAGLAEDTGIATLQAAAVERVMQAKALGAWNLHCALAQSKLDFFVCYSSVSATLGNAGQLNYAAANAFLDGLALHRRAQGQAGTSIGWGVIGDVGMVARDASLAGHLDLLGLRGMASAQALAVLESALQEHWGQFGAFDIDWQRWQERLAGPPARRLSEMLSVSADNSHPAAPFRQNVATAASEERWQKVYAEVAERICGVLKLPASRVDALSNLTDLGVDSLMATEIALVLERCTGYRFRALFLVRGPTIAELSTQILDDILQA